MDITDFQKRIGYQGNLQKLFQKISEDYHFGKLLSYEVVLQGYEDFNAIINTERGKYFVKIFATFRDDEEVQQYVKIMKTAVDSGVSHPKLFTCSNGYLCNVIMDKTGIRLIVMEYIDGEDFFHLKEKPTPEEITFLARQAAKINLLNLKPKFVYDSWAIPNFLNEYGKTKDILHKDDRKFIDPLVKQFESLHLEILPQAFVHGDIIATNTIRSKNDKIYIIDFAVANWYPRIQELAVLLCDLFFVKDKRKYLINYNLTLKEYQKIVKLEQEELEILPTYIKLAHAMHIIPATRENAKGNTLPENDFWLQSGREGIRIASEIWE
jgi:Ser/Thr protein kinase RdoA (MazF antagonist)